MELKVVSWNLCGARYFDLGTSSKTKLGELSREEYLRRLDGALQNIASSFSPDVFALQEVAEYATTYAAPSTVIFDIPDNYRYIPTMLVDNKTFPYANKWQNARRKGNWREGEVLSQGNAFLVKKSLPIFPPTSLPQAGIELSAWQKATLNLRQPDSIPASALVSPVYLESGLYLGDRETEPRCGVVLHIVTCPLMDGHCVKPLPPLDIFIVNLHLTNIISIHGRQRSQIGIQIRKEQINILLETVVRRYEAWRSHGYPIRGTQRQPLPSEEYLRTDPVWVLVGDFNFSSDSPENELLTSSGFHLVQPDMSARPTYCQDFQGKTDVDHVFLRVGKIDLDAGFNYKTSAQVRQAFEFSGVSDHYPLFAKIRIDAPP